MAYEDYADYCIISHEGAEGCLEVGDFYDGDVYLTEDPNGKPTGLWVLVGAGKNLAGDDLYYIIDREYGYGLKVLLDTTVVHEPIADIEDPTDAANIPFKWDIDEVTTKPGVFRIVSFAKQRSSTAEKFLGVTVLTDKQEQVGLVTLTNPTAAEWDISLENEGTEVCPEVADFSKSVNRAKNAKSMQAKASKSGSLGSTGNAAVIGFGIKSNTLKLQKKVKGEGKPNRKKRPGYKAERDKADAGSSPSTASPVTIYTSPNAG